MTREILIVLLLFFVVFESSGQDLKSVLKQQTLYNQVSSNEKWTYSELDSSNISGQTIDTLFSPDKKFKIIVRAVGFSDNVVKYWYWLIRTIEKDTTELMTAARHDLSPPHFVWTSNGYLVYDHIDYGENPGIQMRNLSTNIIDFSTPGLYPHLYDQENNVIIYHQMRTRERDFKCILMALYIDEQTVSELVSFQAWEYSYPFPTMDIKSRTLKLIHHEFTKKPTNSIPARIETELKY